MRLPHVYLEGITTLVGTPTIRNCTFDGMIVAMLTVKVPSQVPLTIPTSEVLTADITQQFKRRKADHC